MSPADSANPAWLTVPPAGGLPEAVGFTDADILHIVEVTAIFNYNVRLAIATGLFPNAGYHTLGRAAQKEG